MITKIVSAKLIYLLLIFFVALLAIFYNFTKPAFDTWKDLQMLQIGMKKMARVSETEKVAMRAYILKNTFAGKQEKLQQSLFYSLTSACDSLQLSLNDFSALADAKKDNTVQVVTNKVTVEGDFKNIVRMLYVVETSFNGSTITSASFYVRKHPTTRLQKLVCDIYLQSILKKE